MLALLLSLAHASQTIPTSPPPPLAVTPMGWVRPAFSWIQDDDAVSTDQDGFTLAARLGATAAYKGLVTAKLEVDLAPQPSLKDAVVAWTPVRYVRVDLGQYKLPVSASYQASDTRRLLPTDPRVVSELASRDIGAAASFFLPVHDRIVATATSGVYNGEGANVVQNVNQRFEYVERLLITPFGARKQAFEGTDGELWLGIGGEYVYNYTGDGESAEESNAFGGDVQFAWSVLSAQAEVLSGSHVHANATVADEAWFGWYAQVGSFVPAGWAREHLEVVARLGEDDPSTESQGDATGPEAPHSRELSVGANLYAAWSGVPLHDVKLQAAFTHRDELEGPAVANDSFTAAFVVRY